MDESRDQIEDNSQQPAPTSEDGDRVECPSNTDRPPLLHTNYGDTIQITTKGSNPIKVFRSLIKEIYNK